MRLLWKGKTIGMAKESGSCLACGCKIAKGKSMMGDDHLPHSDSPLIDTIKEIIDEHLCSVTLCCQCQELIVRIDFHKHELQILKEEFIKLYIKTNGVSRYLSENNTNISLVCTSTGNIASCNDIFNSKSSPIVDCKMIENNKKEDELNSQEEYCRSVNEKIELQELTETSEMPAVPLEPLEKDCVNKCTDTSETKVISRERRRIKKNQLDDFVYDMGHTNKDYIRTDRRNGVISEIPCNVCGESFITKKIYFQHDCLKKKRRKNDVYRCKGCQKEFSVRRDYIQHIDVCYKNTPVKCHLCLVKLTSAAYLPRHLESFHGEATLVPKGSLCEQCGRSFSRKESLERHQAGVHGVSHGSHQCSKCGRTFLHTTLLAEHMRAHKGYTCSTCNKTFSCMSNLNLHKRAHHLKKAIYYCSSCNKRWRFQASYAYHMRKVHSLEHHKCCSCNKSFSTKRDLMIHKDSCHSPIDATDDDDRVNAAADSFEQLSTKLDNYMKSDPCGKKNESSGDHTLTNITDMNADKSKNIIIQNKTQQLQYLKVAKSCESLLLKDNYDDSQKVKEEVIVMSTVTDEKESQVLYEVDNIEASGPASEEIILETIEDSRADYQYVILVEECNQLAG